ncbi:MAG: 3',5'-cyclic-AMP phosphodiesterase [Bdellovibrio bacteriovorus]
MSPGRPTHPRAGQDGPRPLRLVQITDSHLFADPRGKLLGLTTRDSFLAVLALALGTGPRPDALVMTGDLVHDETAEAYAYLQGVLEATGLPCYCIPGNHDQPELMTQWLGAAALDPVASRRLGRWNLLFLDSTRPGEEGGHLEDDQLAQLDRLLSGNPSPSLVFLHQHPTSVHSAWMDTMDVANGAELIAVCDRHPNVRALVFGHIHQEFVAEHGGYHILGAPSTCVQFLPESEDFALDTRPPGYRELLLYADGRLETWVRRLAAYPERPNAASNGY